jgi:hypothetical protein
MDIEFDSILGDVFPHLLPAARCLLNCVSNCIKRNYIWVLDQLSSRHHIFKKYLLIDQDSAYISQVQVQLWMNKVTIKLGQFMKSSKHTSHKFKRTNIEWSPYAGVWIHNDGFFIVCKPFWRARQGTPGTSSKHARNSVLRTPIRSPRTSCEQNFMCASITWCSLPRMALTFAKSSSRVSSLPPNKELMQPKL